MENLPNCPKCNSEYTYEDGSLLICPECGHELVKRKSRYGTTFIGCSNYPKCHYIKKEPKKTEEDK